VRLLQVDLDPRDATVAAAAPLVLVRTAQLPAVEFGCVLVEVPDVAALLLRVPVEGGLEQLPVRSHVRGRRARRVGRDEPEPWRR
jgi:hypothetical protein